MKNETKIIIAIGVISMLISYSLFYFLRDDSNGSVGGTMDGHGFMKLASWYHDSSGYHLNFSVDGFNNYYKNFSQSKVTDIDQYVGHYVEVGYNSYDDRLNYIHIVKG